MEPQKNNLTAEQILGINTEQINESLKQSASRITENIKNIAPCSLTQTFLVCILKNHGHKIRTDENRTFATTQWYNTFTNESWEEETEVTGYTHQQIKDYLGY